MCGAATKADLSDDLVRFQQSHVFEEQADHTLAFTLRSGRIVPEARKVRHQRHYLLTLLRAEHAAFSVALMRIVLLGRGECTQFAVPLRLQGIGDQAVVRIDVEVASLSKLRFVPRTLHLLAPHTVHLLGTHLELALYGQRNL